MMRLLSVTALAAAAACGGSSSTAPPVANTVATAAVTSPAEHLVAIQDLARKGCACADRTCLAAVDREFAELVRSIDLEPHQAMKPEQVRESFAALEKLSVCMTDQKIASPELGRAIVDRYAALAELNCECVDDECRTEVLRMLPEAVVAFYFPLEDDAYTAYEEIQRRFDACGDAAPETAQARAIRELTELRDRACACSDADCAEKVQADFDVFLENHANTQGSQADAETIGALAGEMSGCLSDAMPATH